MNKNDGAYKHGFDLNLNDQYKENQSIKIHSRSAPAVNKRWISLRILTVNYHNYAFALHDG